MLQKRFIIIYIAVLSVIFLGGIIFLGVSQKPQQLPSEELLFNSKEAKVPSSTLKQYNDSSGFSFRYPEDIEIKQELNLDDSTYARLVLSSPGVSGDIEITVTDSPYDSLDLWEKNNKKMVISKGSPARLGDIQVKEYQAGGKLITAGIDNAILFIMSVDFQNDEGYWGGVYNTLVSSFSFTLPQPVQSSTTVDSSGDEGAIEEEGEEIVE